MNKPIVISFLNCHCRWPLLGRLYIIWGRGFCCCVFRARDTTLLVLASAASAYNFRRTFYAWVRNLVRRLLVKGNARVKGADHSVRNPTGGLTVSV